MHQSHVIEVSGQFAGVAVSLGGAFRFVAVDPQVGELDRSLWPSLPEMRQAVARLMRPGAQAVVMTRPYPSYLAPPQVSP